MDFPQLGEDEFVKLICHLLVSQLEFQLWGW